MINIKGTYVFKQGNNIIFEGENLITFFGESFFLNRCINDAYNPIQYLALGNAESIPLRSDTKLGNETVRKTCTKDSDLYEKQVLLKASFTSTEVVGATEIGVYASNQQDNIILISHDTFDKIKSELLINLTGTVEVEYTFQFTTSTVKTGWQELANYPNVYYAYEPSTIIGVAEDKNGYVNVANKEKLLTQKAGYYYDNTTQNIYIRPTTDSIHPDNLTILLQTKEGGSE